MLWPSTCEQKIRRLNFSFVHIETRSERRRRRLAEWPGCGSRVHRSRNYPVKIIASTAVIQRCIFNYTVITLSRNSRLAMLINVAQFATATGARGDSVWLRGNKRAFLRKKNKNSSLNIIFLFKFLFSKLTSLQIFWNCRCYSGISTLNSSRERNFIRGYKIDLKNATFYKNVFTQIVPKILCFLREISGKCSEIFSQRCLKFSW